MPHYQNSITAAVAKLTIQGREQAVKEGRVVGVAPLGYINVFDRPGGKTAVLDPERAPIIAHMFCLAAEGTSLRTILSRVQELGLTSRNGKPISLSTLYEVLSNSFFMGLLRYKGELY